MPLSINVGLSRKASKDFQSTGYSINVTAELDQSLLARPDELQARIDGLYGQAEQALDRQAGIPDQGQQGNQRTEHQPQHARQPNRSNAGPRGTNARSSGYSNTNSPQNRNGGGNGNGNGHTNGQGNGQAPRNGSMTDSQLKAINAISRRLNIDPAYEVQENFGWVLNELTVKEASQVIDHLKGMQQNGASTTSTPSRNGGGR